MPKLESDVPDALRPFIFHGVDLSWREGDKEALAECPWCGRGNKFSVTVATGVWRCFGCNEGTEKDDPIKGGNNYVFIRKLWERSSESTSAADLEELGAELGLQNSTQTIPRWGVCKSFINQRWLVPGYNAKADINQLYSYRPGGERWVLFPTPCLGQKERHGIHGVGCYVESKPEVHLCEGWKDGLAYYDALNVAKRTDDGRLLSTGNEAASLLSTINVLAVPGCETFFESWLPLFRDKDVVILYDNDLPRKHPKTGKDIAPGGLNGTKRVAGFLLGVARSIRYLRWGPEGYNTGLPTGFDVRDQLCA